MEVSEDFVMQYNQAESIAEKERFEDSAKKMLNRIKVYTNLYNIYL